MTINILQQRSVFIRSGPSAISGPDHLPAHTSTVASRLVTLEGRSVTMAYYERPIASSAGSSGLRTSKRSSLAVLTDMINVAHNNRGAKAKDLAFQNGLLYVAWGTGGVKVYDVSCVYRIRNLHSFSFDGVGTFKARQLCTNKQLVYTTIGREGFKILMPRGDGGMIEIGSLKHHSCPAHSIAVENDTAFVTFGTAGIIAVDVTDPSNPTEMGVFKCDKYEAESVVVEGGWAYVSFGTAGLRILDVTQPQTLHAMGTYKFLEWEPLSVSISKNLLVVAYGFGGLKIVDVTNPAAPIEAGSYKLSGYPIRHAFVKENIILAAADIGGLKVLDCSEPTSIKEVASFHVPEQPVKAVEMNEEGIAFVRMGSGGGIVILNLSDPQRPQQIGNVCIQAPPCVCPLM